MINKDKYFCKWKPIVEPRRSKPKTYRQAQTHWLKFYDEAVIESEARTAVMQLKSEARNEVNTAKVGQYDSYWPYFFLFFTVFVICMNRSELAM